MARHIRLLVSLAGLLAVVGAALTAQSPPVPVGSAMSNPYRMLES